MNWTPGELVGDDGESHGEPVQASAVVCGGQTDVTVRICLAVVIVVTNTQYAINDWKLLWLFCGLSLSYQLIVPALTGDFPPSCQQSGEWWVIVVIIVILILAGGSDGIVVPWYDVMWCWWWVEGRARTGLERLECLMSTENWESHFGLGWRYIAGRKWGKG